MRRKLILGGLVLLAVIGMGYVLGITALVLAFIAFGLGFFIGKSKAAH